MGNHVHEYVEAELKKVFEFLWSNGDDEKQNKLMYWKQESADKFSNAMTAAKFEGMGGRWWKRWQQKTKKKTEFINNSLTENKTWATNHYRILTYLNKGCLRRILQS
jgi:hypothetical protein